MGKVVLHPLRGGSMRDKNLIDSLKYIHYTEFISDDIITNDGYISTLSETVYE